MRSRWIPVVWTAVVVALAVWLSLALLGREVINSNFMAFLPQSEAGAPRAAVDQVERRFQRQLLILVGAQDRKTAVAAARHVREALIASRQFGKVTLRQNPDLPRQTAAFYFPLRFQILSHQVRAELQQKDSGRFERAVLDRYFGPQSMIGSGIVARDPLLLLPRFLAERAEGALASARIEDGLLTVHSGGKSYIVMVGDLAQSPFSIPLQQAVGAELRSLRGDLARNFAGAELLVTGVLPHAIAGTASAYRDISAVGAGSLLGIVLLLVGIFRSWKPLGLSVLSIVAGCIGGAASCLLVFGQIHLLTLVFGSSLVGISVDYSLHFFCDRFRLRDGWSPELALRHIFPGITLGLVTSLIGFAGLFFAPFPGMQGMALFSSVGLLFAYICLFAWYPWLTRTMAAPRLSVLIDWARRYGDLWRGRRGTMVGLTAVVLVVAAGTGCLRLVVRDDIRLMQKADPHVMAEEARTRALIGRNLSGQFFLVQGLNADDYLDREEQLTARLRHLESRGLLTGYLAISDFVASPRRQEDNLRLFAPVMTKEDGAFNRIAQRIGLTEPVRNAYLADYRAAVTRPPVTLDAWLASPVSAPYRHLWMGAEGGKVTAVVHLRGVRSLAALRQAADPGQGIYFIDPAGAVSAAFAAYRHHTIWLTLIAYCAVAGLVLLRYGLAGGAAVMAVPSLAALASLGLLGWAGEAISMFNVMALLLVLGIGIDYALFFRETGVEGPSTLLAIALSCLTTVLAFGILAFSSTAAIHSFGLTILVGILSAFLLSPLAGILSPARRTP